MAGPKRSKARAKPANQIKRFEAPGVALGESSGIRAAIRAAQWNMPWQAQALLLPIFGDRFDPYMDWHRRHRAIFIHVPRTGGSSVSKALGLIQAHFPVARYLAFDRDLFHSAFKFAFVRNPWERLLSVHALTRANIDSEWELGRIWAKATLEGTSNFEEFVLSLEDPRRRRRVMRYPLFRPQLDWLRLPVSRRMPVDFVGRFERLEEDFNLIAKKIGIEAELPHISPSVHQYYRDEYSTRMRDIVSQVYGGTIAAFDYRF